MGGIAVLSNPRSGRNRRNPQLLQRLAWVLGDKGELAQPPDLDHLEDTIRQFRARDIDILCVNGGDGTLHKVMSAVVRVYGDGKTGRALTQVPLPPIAILRSGTVNTISRNIGLKMAAKPFLGHIVDAWQSDAPLKTVERNVMVVNHGEASGFLFGTGVLSRFMEAYYAGGDAGPVKALKVLTRAVLSSILGTRFSKELFARDPHRVTVDGEPWHAAGGYAAVAAATVNDLGLGFRLFHAAKDHPDHVHVLGFPCGPLPVVRGLHRVYLNKPYNRPDDIYDQVARSFTIEADQPLPFMMDGDFVRTQAHQLHVQVGPRVRFVVP